MKDKKPNKFNKTRHSDQKGTKTALAWWKFTKNRYNTEKHPAIISKVKCSSKVETILSFQEKQMLEGLVNAVQTSQRDAIRIALYELHKTPLEAPLRLVKYASKERPRRKVMQVAPTRLQPSFRRLRRRCSMSCKPTAS